MQLQFDFQLTFFSLSQHHHFNIQHTTSHPMARKRRDKSPSSIKLRHPDRSATPNEQTLLDLAQQRDLFAQAKEREAALKGNTTKPADEEESDPLPPVAERIFETLLWT